MSYQKKPYWDFFFLYFQTVDFSVYSLYGCFCRKVVENASGKIIWPEGTTGKSESVTDREFPWVIAKGLAFENTNQWIESMIYVKKCLKMFKDKMIVQIKISVRISKRVKML